MKENYAVVEGTVSPKTEYGNTVSSDSTELNKNDISNNRQLVKGNVFSPGPSPVYYVGDVTGRDSGIELGKSKYDQSIPFTGISDVNNYRANQQGFFTSLANGLISRIGSVVPKALTSFGFIKSLPEYIASGDVSKMTKNQMSTDMQSIDNALRKAFPVYASDAYNGSVWAKMGTRKFWFDDAFDGVAFSASAYLPAGIFSKAGELLGLAAKTEELFVAGNKIGAAILKNVPEALVTSYNVASEAGFEARDAQKTVFNSLIKAGIDPTDAKKRADDAAKHTFMANNVLLILPDAIEAKFFLGGFKKGVNKIEESVRKAVLKGEKFSINPIREAAGKVILAMGAEGVWEEGIQNGVQQWELRAAKNGSYDNKDWLKKMELAVGGDFEEYFKGFSTNSGISSMVLGAVTGGLMGGAFTFSQSREEERQAKTYHEDWSNYEKEVLNRNNEFFKNRIINNVNKEDGTVDVNEMARSIYRTIYDKQAFDEEMAAMSKDDKFHHLYNQEMNTARFIYSYLADENFGNTDMAFDYAMKHLDKIKETIPDDVDEKTFSKIKDEAKNVKDIYDNLEKERIGIDGLTDDQKKENFGRLLNKTILYETLKQSYLNDIKPELSSKNGEAIDNMIADSQKRIDNLKDKTKRESLFKDYKDSQTNIKERINKAKELMSIVNEISNNKDVITEKELTKKQLDTKAKRYRHLLYSLREDEIINGERFDSYFDSAIDSENGLDELGKAKLGLLNNARFIAGMSYQKNAIIRKMVSKYDNGTASVSDVIASIRDNTTSLTPYTTNDIIMLKSLLRDSRSISNSANEDLLTKYNVYKQNSELIGEKDAREKSGITDTEIKEANKVIDAKKNISEISNIIQNNEKSAKLNLSENDLKENSRLDHLQGIAMSQFLNEEVVDVIKTFDSNKEIFSNVDAINTAAQSLSSAEEALNDKNHIILKNSTLGKAIAEDIIAYKAKLIEALNTAIINKDNKSSDDIKHEILHGIINKSSFIGGNNIVVRDLINKYLGNDYIDKVISFMKEDNNNPIYIEKVVKDLKKLKPEEQKAITKTLNRVKEEKALENSEKLWEIIKESPAGENLKLAKQIFGRDLKLYEKSPEGYFKYILKSIGLQDNNTEVRTPFEVYTSKGSFVEFYDILLRTDDNTKSGLERIDVRLLKDLSSTHAEIESIDNILSGMTSDGYNRTSILSNEKSAFEKEDSQIYPSRQQRIAISDLIRWFKNKNKVNENEKINNGTLYAFSYLRGIAGSGKTTVVSKLFLNQLGIKLEDILAFGNNDSSTGTINQSLGTTSETNTGAFSKDDIKDNTRLIVIDEIGSVGINELKNIANIVNKENTKRRNNNKEELKVLLMGDPTQISGKSFMPEIERSSNKIYTLKQISPLTIAYRSNIGDIVNFQTLFMDNRSEVLGVKVAASAPIGKEAIGVHVSDSENKMIQQLEVSKDNGKSKVIIVSNNDDIAKYDELKSRIKNLEVLTIDNVQGRTFDEAYINLNLSEYDNTGIKDGTVYSNNIKRNKIIYTATSRASDYIFMVDKTSSFKNSISKTVEESKKRNEDALNNYRTEYGNIINHDMSVLSGSKKVENKEPIIKDQTTEADVPEKLNLDDLNVPDVPVEDSPDETNKVKYDVNSTEDAVSGKFEKTSSDIHTLNNPQSITEKVTGFLNRFNIKSLLTVGNTVFYTRMRISNKTRIVAISYKNEEEGVNAGFYIVGYLGDKESEKYLGGNINSLTQKGLPTATFGLNGKIRNFDENGDYILRKGKVNATQALTYIFNKKTVGGGNIVEDALQKVQNVFSANRGFKLNNAYIKILNKADLRDESMNGLQAGIPYLFMEFEGKKGTYTMQHVKLSPRMVDSERDGSLVKPLINLVNTLTDIHSTFEGEGIQEKFGSENFNRLIKLFKNNYYVNGMGEIELKTDPRTRVTYEDAKNIIPELTQSAFENSTKSFENIIPMIYGIGEKNIKMSESEFADFVTGNNLSSIGNIDGHIDVFFAGDNSTIENGKGRYYMLDKKTGNIRYWVAHEERGITSLRNDYIDGFAKKYLSSKQMISGLGNAQSSLNLLAKNNSSPGDVDIRTYKTPHIKGKANYRIISAKSLTKSESNYSSYLDTLRQVVLNSFEDNTDKVFTNPYQASMKSLSIENQVSIIEKELLDNNVLDEVTLTKLAEENISKPFNLNDLNKILGFKNGETKSSSLRLPLSMKHINDLGERLDNSDSMDELNGLLEHNLSNVVPTRVQVKLSEQQASAKNSSIDIPVEDKSRKRRAKGRRTNIKPMLRSDEIHDSEDIVTKRNFIKEIEKRVGKLNKEQLKFVDKLLITDPTTRKPVYAYAAVYDDTILVNNDENNIYYKEVAKHEAFHYIVSNILTKTQYNGLTSAFEGEFGDGFSSLSDFEKEEFIAQKFQQYKVNDYTTFGKFITNIFNYIKKFLYFGSTNKDYIESLFRAIEAGKFSNTNTLSSSGDIVKLRSLYGSTNMFRGAIRDITDSVDLLDKNGLEKELNSDIYYPVPTEEMFSSSKKMLSYFIQDDYDELNEKINLFNNTSDKEQDGLRMEIDNISKRIKRMEITMDNFNDMFDITFPNWGKKINFDIDGQEQELNNSELKNVNINDDIIEWDRVDMFQKTSGHVKNILSNIFYKDYNGENRWVSPKYAYLKSLETLTIVQPWSDSFDKQIESLYNNENDPAGKAVIKAIVDLHADSRDLFINGVTARKDIRFFDGDLLSKEGKIVHQFKFIKSEDKNENLYDYKGINNIKTRNIGITEDISNFKTLHEFIDHLNAKYNISVEDLSNAFMLYQKRNSLSEMMSNFTSQRRRIIKFIKEEDNRTTVSFKYLSGSGRTASSTSRSLVREFLIDKISEKKSLDKFITKVRGFVKNQDKAKSQNIIDRGLVENFIKALGLGAGLNKFGLKTGSSIRISADRIRYLFAETETMNNIMLDANAKYGSPEADDNGLVTDEAIERNEDNKMNYISSKLLKEASTMVNSVGDSIDIDSRIKRTTSVKAADGKKKYIYVVSNQAMDLFNTLINKGKSGVFSGLNRKIDKNITLPGNITSTLIKNNIYKNGISKISIVDDYDGKRVETGFSNRTDVIEYKDEHFNDTVDRAFSSQFIDVINSSPKKNPEYVQSMFIVSNKPVHNGIKVSVLRSGEIRNAAISMFRQIFNTEEYSDIKGFDKHKLISMNAFALAIEDAFPGTTDGVYNKKNGGLDYYRIKEKSFDKLKDIFDKNDTKLITKLLDSFDKQIDNNSKELVNLIIKHNVSLPLEDFINEKLLGLLPKEERQNVLKLKLKRSIDPITNEIVYSKEKNTESIPYRESLNDVIERIVKSKKYGNTFDDGDIGNYKSFIKKAELIRKSGGFINTSPKMLINNDEIFPVIRLFSSNDLVQSHQLTQLVSGDFRFFKNSQDLVKRLSGAFAPGMRGNVNDDTGMSRYTNIAVIKDVTYNNSNIHDFLSKNLGLNDSSVTKLMKYYNSSDTEYSDAQGFMLPERHEEIVSGFGTSYLAGNVMKPAYYHIDDNGTPRMLKYSSIVLTDDLTSKFEVLNILRNKMRNGGENGNTIIGEVVFASGNKVGQPKNLVDINNDILSKNGYISENSMFNIDNTDYRMQLNPLHDSFASVANPTQLVYFLNTAKENLDNAASVYKYSSKIIENNFVNQQKELATVSGIQSTILTKLKAGANNEDIYELMKQFMSDKDITRPWDFPQISSKTLIALMSHINKSVTQIRFKGTKAILQTAFGTENLDLTTLELADSLEYNHEKVKGYDNKDVMYAEAIFPKGLLPKEVEKEVLRQIKLDKKNGGRGVANMEFLTPDALGFRLPSSELHSAVPLRIRGFYDSVGTNVIITPKQIVDLHGSDYDVDALFMIIREYQKDGDNRTNIPIGYKKNDETRKYEFDYKYLDSEDFNKLPTELKNKHLKNAILENMLDVVSRMGNRERMAQPISMKIIKDDIKKINELRSNAVKKSHDLSNFVSRQLMHSSSYEASTAVGIWANAIKVMSYLQRTNDGVNPELYYFNNKLKIEDNAFHFNGSRYAILSNSKETYENLDGFINSTIDNVKEQDLPELNMTSNNIRGYVSLMAFGFDLKEANRIYSQEAINYTSRFDKQPTMLINKIRQIVSATLGENVDSSFSNSNFLNVKSLEKALGHNKSLDTILTDYENGIKPSPSDIEFLLIQAKTLSIYNKALNLGKTLSNISKMLSVLRETPTSKEELDNVIELKEKLIEDLGEGVYKSIINEFDFSDIMKELPHLKIIYDVLNFEKKLIENNYTEYNSSITDALNKIHKTIKVVYDQDPIINKKTRNLEFYNFLLKQINFDSTYKGFKNEEPITIGDSKVKVYGEKAFKERLIQTIVSLKINKEFENNIFIHALEISRDNTGARTINFPIGNNMDYGDIIDFQNAFNDLVNYNSDGTDRFAEGNVEGVNNYSELQKDLFRFLIVNDGLTFSPNSYIQIIPAEMKIIFQKKFNDFIYDPEKGIVYNKTILSKVMNIYENGLVVNHPELLQRKQISKYAIKSDENNENNYNYTKDIPNGKIYGDLAFKSFIREDGTLNVEKTMIMYPKYVRSLGKMLKNNKIISTIYRRVYLDDDVVLYQRINSNNFTISYSYYNESKIDSYDSNKAFSPFIEHLKTKTLNTSTINSNKDLSIGEAIALSEYSDPARVNTKYFKIISKKVIDENKIAYSVKEITDYNITSSKQEMLDKLSNGSMDDLFSKNKNSIQAVSVLNFINTRLIEYKDISTSLLKFSSLSKTKITNKRIRNKGIIGEHSKEEIIGREFDSKIKDLQSTVSIDLNKIQAFLSNDKMTDNNIAKTVLHEQIHRYSSSILDIYNMANQLKESNKIDNVEDYLNKIGMNPVEIDFAKRTISLFGEYRKNGDKGTNYYSKIDNVKEFIAYGLTEPNVILELKSIKTENKSLFKKLIDYIQGLFGIKDDSLYSFLYSSFDKFADENTPFANQVAVSVKTAIGENGFKSLIDFYTKSKHPTESISEALTEGEHILNYENTLYNLTKDTSIKEFKSSELLKAAGEIDPVFKYLADELLELNKSISGRIANISLEGRTVGETFMETAGLRIKTAIAVDMHYINNLSSDMEENIKQLTATILHEEVHRYTSVLHELGDKIKLKEFEKSFLKNTDLLLRKATRDLRDLKNAKFEPAEFMYDKIYNDVDELIAYGVTDKTFSTILDNLVSPLNPANSILEDLENEVFKLFTKSKNNASSVYNHIVQTNLYNIKEEDRVDTQEDDQRKAFGCGL